MTTTLNTTAIKTDADGWIEEAPIMYQAQSTSVLKKEPEKIQDKIIDGLTQTKDLLVNESKTLAPEMVANLQESNKRMEDQKRIISFMPNNYLYYGLVAIGVIVIIKVL
jgi:hypothetical protein